MVLLDTTTNNSKQRDYIKDTALFFSVSDEDKDNSNLECMKQKTDLKQQYGHFSALIGPQ